MIEEVEVTRDFFFFSAYLTFYYKADGLTGYKIMAYGAFFCLKDFGETNQFKAFHWINVSRYQS